MRRFLQFALKPLGYLLERLFDGRSRPGCLYDHGLDDEGRIFAAAKSEIGQDAGDDGNDHDVGDERAVFERPFGEIDHGSDPSRRILLARVKGLNARCDHDFAGVQPLGNDHPRLVEAQDVDVSD